MKRQWEKSKKNDPKILSLYAQYRWNRGWMLRDIPMSLPWSGSATHLPCFTCCKATTKSSFLIARKQLPTTLPLPKFRSHYLTSLSIIPYTDTRPTNSSLIFRHAFSFNEVARYCTPRFPNIAATPIHPNPQLFLQMIYTTILSVCSSILRPLEPYMIHFIIYIGSKLVRLPQRFHLHF